MNKKCSYHRPGKLISSATATEAGEVCIRETWECAKCGASFNQIVYPNALSAYFGKRPKGERS